MGKHDEYMFVDGTRVTVAAFDAMPKEDIKYITAPGCTSLTEINAPSAREIFATGCASLTELNAPNAVEIYAIGCTALTVLHADNAEYINVRDCTALTKIHAPKATYIDASGCTSLTEINAPKVFRIDTIGCTALTGMIHGGKDSRGYHFFGFPQSGKYRIFAGCRNFTLDEAIAHWGPGGPSDRPDCLALVEKIVDEIKTKEQA